MSIYWSRAFPRSNSSFFLRSGYPSKSSVIRLREEKFLMDPGLGTPKIRMKDELTNVPQYPARFENTVGYSFNVVAGALKKRRNYERFFKDLVAGESRIKERAAANLNSFLGSLDVAAGEPLVLPQRFRKKQARKELNTILRMIKWLKRIALMERTKSLILQTKKNKFKLEGLNKELKKANFYLEWQRAKIESYRSLTKKKKQEASPRAYLIRRRQIKQSVATVKQVHARLRGFIINKAKRKKRKGFLVAIAGFLFFTPVFKKKKRKGKKGVKQKKMRKNAFSEKRHLFTY